MFPCTRAALFAALGIRNAGFEISATAQRTFCGVAETLFRDPAQIKKVSLSGL
jgi:hypothetical protein